MGGGSGAAREEAGDRSAERQPGRCQSPEAYPLIEEYDAIVSTGLLMFLDPATAHAQLDALMAHVRPGGIAAINVLVRGTTYLDMFDPQACCLFGPDELETSFAGWELLQCDFQEFPAAKGTLKRFATLVARGPRASSPR